MDIISSNPEVGTAVVQLGISLSELALKGTASSIHTKIETIKTLKEIDKVRNAYDEIISQLLEEREEAVRIAQTYRQELERVVISDEDIEYLQDTISKVLDIFKQFQPETKGLEEIDKLKGLVSKEVLKTMQLLGFNYKEAIGVPLTNLCAGAIQSMDRRASQSTTKAKR